MNTLLVLSLQRRFREIQARHAAALDRGDQYSAELLMEQMRLCNIQIAAIARGVEK